MDATVSGDHEQTTCWHCRVSIYFAEKIPYLLRSFALFDLILRLLGFSDALCNFFGHQLRQARAVSGEADQ